MRVPFVLVIAITANLGAPAALAMDPPIPAHVLEFCAESRAAAARERDARLEHWRSIRASVDAENARRRQVAPQMQALSERIWERFRAELGDRDREQIQRFPADLRALLALNGGQPGRVQALGWGGDLAEHASALLVGLIGRSGGSVTQTLANAIRAVTDVEPQRLTGPFSELAFVHSFSTRLSGDSGPVPVKVHVRAGFVPRNDRPYLSLNASFQAPDRAWENYGVRDVTETGTVPGILFRRDLLTGSVEVLQSSAVLGTVAMERAYAIVLSSPVVQSTLVCQLIEERLR